MAEELPKIILSSSDRIMHRVIDKDPESPRSEYGSWAMSDPIPGVRIVNTWEVYHNMHLVLTVTEEGHYNIFWSLDLKKYSLVHSHQMAILNLFYIDEGHMLFSAEDGWWKTTDTGLTWLSLGEGPVARSAVSIATSCNSWVLIAYGQDHKLYSRSYPQGEWSETFDTNKIWQGQWYPAMAGSPEGILVGAGTKLLRFGIDGAWKQVAEVDGTIKSIVVSDQSNQPTFLIEVEKTGQSKLYWTYDLGDSIIPDLNRVSPISSVQSVYPTGTEKLQTIFVFTHILVAVGNRNEERRRRGRDMRRERLDKIHLAVDIETQKPVAFELTMRVYLTTKWSNLR